MRLWMVVCLLSLPIAVVSAEDRFEFDGKTLFFSGHRTGHSVSDFAALDGAYPIFTRSFRLPSGVRHFVSLRFGGLLYTDDSGRTLRRSRGLPKRPLFDGAFYRDVLNLWQNPQRPEHLLAVNKHDVLESTDGGASFRIFHDGEVEKIGGRNTFTAIAGGTDAKGALTEIWLGTSIRGVVRLSLSGKTKSVFIQKGVPFLRHRKSVKFYEKIVDLVVDKRGVVFALTEFQPALCVLSGASFTAHPLPGKGLQVGVSLFYEEQGGRMFVTTDRQVFETEAPFPKAPRWSGRSVSEVFGDGAFGALLRTGQGALYSNANLARVVSARSFARRDLRGIYVSYTTARKKRAKLYRLIDRYGFNAAVVDIKDDAGRLLHGSKLPEARIMGNHIERIPIRKLLGALRKRDVYTIARIVVFKDPKLFSFKNNKYSIRNWKTGKPWIGVPGERWTDGFSTFVHDYNLRVADEAEALGFDEIQFDYIRFPTDGPIWQGKWLHKPKGAYRSEAIEAFLHKARQRLTIPISADLYGYNAIYREGSIIGQDVVDMGEFVDVISPMHYSSHFGDDYLGHVSKDNRTRMLLKLGCERPRMMGFGRYMVRPWLQAFRMKISIWGWGDSYMKNQIQGTKEGGGQGYLWWGPLDNFHLPGRVQQELSR